MASTTAAPTSTITGTVITITTTGTAITTTTTDGAFARLLAWTSPAYPVGGFSYSHGLETAVEEGLVTEADALRGYVEAVLTAGAGHVDAALLAAAHRAALLRDDAALDAVAELAAAWRGTAEQALEATQQGGSFASVTVAAWPDEALAAFAARHKGRLAHAVAFGAAAGFAALPSRASLVAYLSGFAANLVSAGVRLVPLGQTDGQRVTAALAPLIARCAEQAEGADLESIGTSALRPDLLSMRHETQYTRLFRS
ncbi:MAG: urease accessory protein UreF [Acetobacteraceae bacterium]|nr:urease accessory protein UreF [Acetobacteraceae bacterium]